MKTDRLFNILSGLTLWAARQQEKPEFLKNVRGYFPGGYNLRLVGVAGARVAVVAEDKVAPVYRITMECECRDYPSKSDWPHYDLYLRLDRTLPLGDDRDTVVSSHRLDVGQIRHLDEKDMERDMGAIFSQWNTDDDYANRLVARLTEISQRNWTLSKQPDTDGVQEAELRPVL